MTRKQLGLTAFLLAPVVLFVGLMWVIALSKPLMDAPPVGAGAGGTGGANAIGELLAGHRANAGAVAMPFDREVEAETQATAPAQPPTTGAAGDSVRPEMLATGFVLIVRDASGKASPSSPIYLAGNVNNWNPADPAYRLEAQSDMRWRLIMDKPAVDKMEFKFTRGSWELEELKADMSVPGNRTLDPILTSTIKPGERPTIELTVHHWSDEKPEFAAKKAIDPYRSITPGGGSLRRLQVQGGVGDAERGTRDVLIWLPPGYNDAANRDRHYPVLYMHDGQNLFEKLPSIPDEWHADETAAKLVSEHAIEPLIIVGVPHSGATRIGEYSPFEAVPGVVPMGEEHVAWLGREVVPRVERAFRVDSSRAGVGGSSMGALISLYAATSRPETFRWVLAESLPISAFAPQSWSSYVGSVRRWPDKVYLGGGGKEFGAAPEQSQKNQDFADAIRAFADSIGKTSPNTKVQVLIAPEATHNERAWADRFGEAITFLVPAEGKTSR
ncbi:MAG: alpha/beta hydrolase [Phycisphaerales bacterium]|nr:MAG: alpha/beta hydrolase [Phycisphaerales bacterium]